MDQRGQTPDERITELTARLARLERRTERARGQEGITERRVRAMRYLLPVLGGLTSTFLAWPPPVGWRPADRPLSNAYWDSLGAFRDQPTGWLWWIGTLGLIVVIAGSIRAFQRAPVTRNRGLAAVSAGLALSVVAAPFVMGVWQGARVGDLGGWFLMFVSAVAFTVVCLTDPKWEPPAIGRTARHGNRAP